MKHICAAGWQSNVSSHVASLITTTYILYYNKAREGVHDMISPKQLSFNGFYLPVPWLCVKLAGNVLQSSSSVFRRPLRERAASFEELSAAPWTGSGGSTKSTSAVKAPAPKTVAKQPKLLFVHFQINRVHCRVTYTVNALLWSQ